MANVDTKTFRGVAVDVGNSAVHMGWFDGSAVPLPRPASVLLLENSHHDFRTLGQWVDQFGRDPVPWCIASVNDCATGELTNWLNEHLPAHPVRHITHEDCPLPVRVEHPNKVGVDRLMAVVAAQGKCGDKPAIVIDAGTAVTVDVLAEGAFVGGAILPGMRMMAAALDRYTDKLPLIDTVGMVPPEAVGRSTIGAMKSGMYWGTVGAICELCQRIGEGLPTGPRIFLTGGDGRALAKHIPEAEFVSDMVLTGIAVAAFRGDDA